MALKLVACLLLLEITTFLRECYRTLPRPTRAQTRSAHLWGDIRNKAVGSAIAAAAAATSAQQPMTASGRRWSMAAQSLGKLKNFQFDILQWKR